MPKTTSPLTYGQRLDMLRATKLEQTRQKQECLGAMDYDDQGQILPPAELTDVVEVTSGSGITVRQPVLKAFRPVSSHPSGGFFGPKATGELDSFAVAKVGAEANYAVTLTWKRENADWKDS